MPEVIVDFLKDGTVEVKAEGFTGSNCIQGTEFLKRLGVVTDFELTEDYYKTTEEVERLRAR